MTFEVDI